MSATDPGFELELAFGLLPALVGVVGLCLVALFPRPRGTAVTGLVLLTLGPLSDVFLYRALSPSLLSAGSYDTVFLLNYLGRILVVAGLLLLVLAATRGPRSREDHHGPEPRRPVGTDPGFTNEQNVQEAGRGDVPYAHRPYGGGL